MDQQSKEKIKPSFQVLAPFLAANGLVLSLVILLIIFGPQLKHRFFQSSLANYDEMIIANGFHVISLENGQSWKLSYEENHDTYFHGKIRHISPINVTNFAILSHDILVTYGDYADPDLVTTNVSNHHFIWRSRDENQPAGTINLLHTVPMNQDIYLKLKAIKVGDTVTIKGWEIARIEGWNSENESVGYWQDAGCNTTLVTEVIVEE